MMYPVAILAGGLATRLRPITENIPKSMVEVAQKPFIHWQLDYLSKQGVSKVVLCVGFLGEQIEGFVGDGSAYGLHVTYSYDGPQLLGTGGALKQALQHLGETFFVFYGDSYLPINFLKVENEFKRQNKPALLTILKNKNQWDKSNIEYRDGRLIEFNKFKPRPEMDYIDYGLGILSASVFSAYPEDKVFDLGEIYYRLSVSGNLAAFEVSERFYEIGSHQGLSETIELLGTTVP